MTKSEIFYWREANRAPACLQLYAHAAYSWRHGQIWGLLLVKVLNLFHTASQCAFISGLLRKLSISIVKINCLSSFLCPLKVTHSFIHSRIYKAPLQEIYSEAPPAQPRRYRSVLSNLQNALSLFLGRMRISKGSPFQVEGPTMENARRCLVAVLA